MLRQLRALLWKEWREGWVTTVLLWCVVPGSGLLAFRPGGTEDWRVASFIAVWLGAAILGGRAFASEAEAGTLRFLARQPVSLGAVWFAKLVDGALGFAVLYLLWACTHRAEDWGHLLEEGNPHLGLLPPAIFAMAFFLSAATDNAVLACVGGFVSGFGLVLLVVAFLMLSGIRPAEGWNPLMNAVVSIAGILFLVLSYAVFRYRMRR